MTSLKVLEKASAESTSTSFWDASQLGPSKVVGAVNGLSRALRNRTVVAKHWAARAVTVLGQLLDNPYVFMHVDRPGFHEALVMFAMWSRRLPELANRYAADERSLRSAQTKLKHWKRSVADQKQLLRVARDLCRHDLGGEGGDMQSWNDTVRALLKMVNQEARSGYWASWDPALLPVGRKLHALLRAQPELRHAQRIVAECLRDVEASLALDTVHAAEPAGTN